MLLRIDPDDPATVATLEACARAVSDLASHRLLAMVEPFISHRVDGRVRNDLSTEAVVRSVTVAAALGSTSAYTWLKLPVVDDMPRVAAASTMPVLLLGGEASVDSADTFERWRDALKQPTVQGMVVGRALLYPPDGDVATAVDKTVDLL
jgi:DhnA family fructose-bisphosphate aldolase class Ia